MRIYLLSIILFANLTYGQQELKPDQFYLIGQFGSHKINIFESEDGFFPIQYYGAVGQGDSINPHIQAAIIRDDKNCEIVIRLNMFELKTDTFLSLKDKYLSIGNKIMAKSNEREEYIIFGKNAQNHDVGRGRIYILDGFELRFNRSEKYYSIFCSDGVFLIKNMEENTKENKGAYILTGTYNGSLETKNHSKIVCKNLKFRIPFWVN
jgi:hypothetical protein